MSNCAPEDSMEKQRRAGFGELHIAAALVHPKPAAINRESQRGAGTPVSAGMEALGSERELAWPPGAQVPLHEVPQPRRHPVPVPTELDELGHNVFGGIS
jgi:hypothetical protein